MRVDLLWGIEGVLTPAPSGDHPHHAGHDCGGLDSWTDMADVRVGAFSCRISPALVERTNFLNRATSGFWLTSWMEFAPRTFAPAAGVHGRSWPVLRDHPEDAPALAAYGWWKAAAVARHLSRTPASRVVWVDDDISSWAIECEASASLLADDRLVAVCPPRGCGLTPGLLSAVEDIVEEVAEREAAA